MPRWSVQPRASVDNSVDKVDNPAKSNIFSHSGPVIGLFAKQPVPGRVKTRLSPLMTPEQACMLYSVALRETVIRLLDAGLPLVICYAGERDWFRETFADIPLLEQRGGGLDARMANAVEDLFALGAGPVLLCGSDSPDLPIGLAVQALDLLQGADVVTVPCCDGGYAMIGLRQQTTEVFFEIPWSTEEVQTEMRRRCRELSLSYRETGGWHDLDEIVDLRRLVKRSPESMTARHVVAQLADLL